MGEVMALRPVGEADLAVLDRLLTDPDGMALEKVGFRREGVMRGTRFGSAPGTTRSCTACCAATS